MNSLSSEGFHTTSSGILSSLVHLLFSAAHCIHLNTDCFSPSLQTFVAVLFCFWIHVSKQKHNTLDNKIPKRLMISAQWLQKCRQCFKQGAEVWLQVDIKKHFCTRFQPSSAFELQKVQMCLSYSLWGHFSLFEVYAFCTLRPWWVGYCHLVLGFNFHSRCQ